MAVIPVFSLRTFSHESVFLAADYQDTMLKFVPPPLKSLVTSATNRDQFRPCYNTRTPRGLQNVLERESTFCTGGVQTVAS